jgi:hypothetical protein
MLPLLVVSCTTIHPELTVGRVVHGIKGEHKILEIDAMPLLPCPFCGSSATFKHTSCNDDSRAPRPHHAYRVECNDCEIAIEETGKQWWSDGDTPSLEDEDDLKAKAEVEQRWNTRWNGSS